MRSEDTFFSRVVETKEEASLIQCISNSAETNGLNDRELNLYSKTTTKKYLKVLIFFSHLLRYQVGESLFPSKIERRFLE